jgi:hypothetical protein
LGDLGHVKVFGAIAVALSLGVKICEFGYSVTVIAPKSTPPQKLSQAVQFANSSLQVIRSSSRNVPHADISSTFSAVNYNVCTEMIDVDYMRKVFRRLETIPSVSNLASLAPGEPSPGNEATIQSPSEKEQSVSASSVPSQDPENPSVVVETVREQKSVSVASESEVVESKSEFESQRLSRDAFRDVFTSFSHMITDETSSIVLCFPDDDNNWICGNILMMYLEDNKFDRSQLRIVAVIKEASWSQKFFSIGITPVYSLSAITDVVSRIAVSSSDEPLVIEPEDVHEMIHPMEAGTKCGLTISEASKVPSVRNFDASPRLMRRMSARSLFDGNSIFEGSLNNPAPLYSSPGTFAVTPQKKPHAPQKISSFNQLSGLGALGLADVTYTEEKTMPTMVFDIYDEHIQQLSAHSPERQPLIPQHLRHSSDTAANQFLLDSPGIRNGRPQRRRQSSYDSN